MYIDKQLACQDNINKKRALTSHLFKMQLLIKLLTPNARAPTRGSEGAAGYDIYSAEDMLVSARSQNLIPTGLAMTVPEGHYGRIAPRSGLAVKHGITVGAVS